MLSAKKLYKSFDSNHVLKNLSIDFPLGKIIMIIGSNGSGKSTLLNCLSRTTEIDRGKINNNGFRTFFLSDKDNVVGNLTIKDNLKIITSLYETDFNCEVFNRYVKQLNLNEQLDKQLKNLSRGNLQKNKMLMALCTNWDYLLLDEPFSNLDDDSICTQKELIKKFKSENKTVIFSTHNHHLFKEIADATYLIQSGSIQNVI